MPGNSIPTVATELLSENGIVCLGNVNLQFWTDYEGFLSFKNHGNVEQ